MPAAQRLHGATMQSDQVPDDGEPEAKTAVTAGRSAVGLAEAIEDEWQELRRDADAAIGHRNLGGTVVGLRETNDDATAGRGELDGIGHQVGDDLLQAAGVATDVDVGRQFGFEADALRSAAVRTSSMPTLNRIGEPQHLPFEPAGVRRWCARCQAIRLLPRLFLGPSTYCLKLFTIGFTKTSGRAFLRAAAARRREDA